jgi:superfamily I DNA/RNA helicase
MHFWGMRRAKMEFPALATETVEVGDRIYPFEAIFYTFLKNQLNSNFVDFDDMIYLSIRALLENIFLRRSYQARFEYVLVDEFQDLNEAQLLLLQILSLPENNIFAVGDDDQMIYGFDTSHHRSIRDPVSSNHVLNKLSLEPDDRTACRLADQSQHRSHPQEHRTQGERSDWQV